MSHSYAKISTLFYQEAMDMLVFNAQKLNNAVKETVRAAEAASIRVRLLLFPHPIAANLCLSGSGAMPVLS